jgi:hypothetical protein
MEGPIHHGFLWIRTLCNLSHIHSAPSIFHPLIQTQSPILTIWVYSISSSDGDPDPDPLVRGTDPDPALDPSLFLINVLSGLK